MRWSDTREKKEWYHLWWGKGNRNVILPCTTTVELLGDDVEVVAAGLDVVPVVGCTSVNVIALDADDEGVTRK